MLASVLEQVEKYRLLEALRQGVPGRTTDRRDAMREVAARFPGALREWEGATASELARRRAAAEELSHQLRSDAAAGVARLATPELAWLRWTIQVQQALRAALARRRLAGERAVTEAGHRFSARIHEEVARAEGISVEVLKAALFPAGDDRSAGSDA